MKDVYLKKEIKYERKAAIAAYNEKKLKTFLFKKIAKYYENKHLKHLGFQELG